MNKARKTHLILFHPNENFSKQRECLVLDDVSSSIDNFESVHGFRDLLSTFGSNNDPRVRRTESFYFCQEKM